ncbi:MAG: metallophosphoesterase [Bacteroidales bacterium]|nr:metallophosphoesterase [Bacteroidales bacterium]
MKKLSVWTMSLLMSLSVFYGGITTAQIQTTKSGDTHKLIGPYLQNMTPHSVTIAWAVKTGSTLVEGKNNTYKKQVSRYTYHTSRLTGLKPDSTYTYDILQDGTDAGKGTFRTFPDRVEPFHFCVLGDTRTRHSVHQQVVNRIIEEKPLFVINTGDLVANGNDISLWETFFDINKDLIRHVPYYTVLGNHEKDSKNYYDFFDLPGNERYYFFSVGDALFVVLDMEGPDYETPRYLSPKSREIFWGKVSKQYFDQEKAWLENLLTIHDDAGYIFVFFHPTWYSIHLSRVAEAARRRAYWGDIFERHHVQVVLNGHDHYYEHAFHGGTHYIVTAGGGAPLYNTDAIQPETIKYKKIEHFMRIDVGPEKATLKAIQLDGTILDDFSVNKRQ